MRQVDDAHDAVDEAESRGDKEQNGTRRKWNSEFE